MDHFTESFETSSRINLLQDQRSKTTNSQSQKPRFIVAIFFIFLFTLIILSIITVYVVSNTHLSLLVANPSDPIRTVCSVTRYRRSCYASITSIANTTIEFEDYWAWPQPDPETIAVLSVRVATNQLTNLSSVLETLVSNSTHPETQSAARDCRNTFLRALRLKNPVMSMGRQGMQEVKSWLFIARAGEENCMRRLIDSGRMVDDGLMSKMYELEEYMSNSLAIVSNMKIIRQKFYEPPQLSDFVLILPQYVVLIFLFCLLFRLG